MKDPQKTKVELVGNPEILFLGIYLEECKSG
jgi:hypothetical protein